MNETHVTVQGNVCTDLITGTSSAGDPFTFFRIGSTVRRQNGDGLWEDVHTSWFDVKTWRGLASNCAASLSKGQPVVVRGKLRTTSYTRQDGSPGIGLVLDAATVGHDLSRGTTTFVKGIRGRGPQVEEDPKLADAHERLDADAGRPAGVDADGVISDDYVVAETMPVP